jgi:hypothetical protein
MDASLSEGEAASSVSLLMYNGILYTGIGNSENTLIPLGKALGTVEIQWHQHRWFDDFYAIRSNSLEVGDTIYEWEGYSSEFRICAVTSDGAIHGFERWYTGDPFGITFAERLEHAVHTMGKSIPDWIRSTEETDDGSIPDYFPDAADIVDISIHDTRGNVLNTIDSPEDIRKIVDMFIKESYYDVLTGNEIDWKEDMLFLYLNLKDGSNIPISLIDKNHGYWNGEISLPKGFFDLVYSYTVYKADVENLNYGAVCAELDYTGTQYLEIQDRYTMYPVWVSNGELRIGHYQGNEYCVLASNAKGCIRVEGTDIWYLTAAGSVSHLSFQYPKEEGSLLIEMKNGADLSPFVTMREVLDEGPFVSLQVRSSVVWTLDTAGNLAKDGKLVEKEVTCFALDGDGVTYGRKDGLFRRGYKDIFSQQVTETEVKAVATAGLYLYYAAQNNWIHKIRVDGLYDTWILNLPVTSLQYSGNQTGGLALMGEDGKAYLLFDDTDLFCVAESVDRVEYGYNVPVAFLYRNGQFVWKPILYESKHGLRMNGKWILPIS